MLQGSRRHLQSGWESPSQPPLGAPPRWVPDARALLTDSLRKQTGRLTQPAVPAAEGGVTKPREFSPLTAQPPTGVGQHRLLLLGWQPGEAGAGVQARWRRGLRALCAALAGGRRGSGAGAGRAWRKRSRTCCTRPGMLREPHTCRARRFSLLPYLTIKAVLGCSSGLVPRGCKRLGVPVNIPQAQAAAAPGIPQERGMGEGVQPFPEKVKIILAEPFPSSLGISRQACDSPGHLGKAQVMLQPQGSSRSLPLRPRNDFLGKPGWNLGKPGWDLGEPECLQLLPTPSLARAARKRWFIVI